MAVPDMSSGDAGNEALRAGPAEEDPSAPIAQSRFSECIDGVTVEFKVALRPDNRAVWTFEAAAGGAGWGSCEADSLEAVRRQAVDAAKSALQVQSFRPLGGSRR